MTYGAPGSRAADMAAQLAAKGLMFDGTQIVPIPATQDPTYDPGYDPAPVGGYAPAPSLGRIDDSPDWNTLMAQLNMAGDMARADSSRLIGNTNALRDRLLGEVAPAFEEQRQGISGSYEARGVGQSGGLETALARNRANEANRITSINQDAAMQVGNYESELARQLAEIEAKRTQSRLDFLSRGYTQ